MGGEAFVLYGAAEFSPAFSYDVRRGAVACFGAPPGLTTRTYCPAARRGPHET